MLPQVVIPDDFPTVMAASAAYQDLAARADVTCYNTLPDSVPGSPRGSEDSLIARISAAEIVVNIRASTKFTAEVFRRCPALRLLSVWGTGTDHIDLAAAAEHGVKVATTPGVSAVAIAEHALALMLAVARRIPALDAQTRAGQWPRGQVMQLRGKTLGIAGLGAVGREFARLGKGIGMRVVAWTMHPNAELAAQLGVQLVSFEELLRSSDVLSLHLRLSPDTKGLIGWPQIELMKPGAILINTARGAIVEDAALVNALISHRIAGAGLDVFDVEPLPAHHPLMALENVVLTPHSAGITPEAVEAGLRMAIRNVWDFVANSRS
jgi:D-3-phosphoglycerate dehydrogenase / 2-oxoglutarate reductase